MYGAIKLFIELPNEIKLEDNINKFKRKLRKYVIGSS